MIMPLPLALTRANTSSKVRVSCLLIENMMSPCLNPDAAALDPGGDAITGVEVRTVIADNFGDVVMDEFDTIVDRGVFTSPQGLVLDASGEHLYVADYVGGLFRVNVSDGEVLRVETPETLSPHGIDGLYRHGNSLIAIQNGIQPNRVTRFDLSDDGESVIDGDILAMNQPWFDDPNLGQVVDDRFVFIANSHWPQFDREGNLPDGLEGPVILEVSLRED